MQRALGMVFLMLCASLTGCVGRESQIIDNGDIVAKTSCEGPYFPEYLVGCMMDEFNLTGDDGVNHTRAGMDSGGRWIAYFSAVWCTHCEPTIDALDTAIPDEQMLIFNKDSRDGYSNVTEWKNNTEESLNRTINKTFVHAPELAVMMNVSSIPYVALIEEGMILAVRNGLWNNATEIGEWFIAENPNSGVPSKLDGVEDDSHHSM